MISLLALAQIVLVLLLLIKLDSFENRVDVLNQSVAQMQASDRVTTVPSKSESLTERAGLDSQQLRQIVREELRDLRSNKEMAAQNSTPQPKEQIVDEAEMLYQRDLVVQELEFLIEQDKVSVMEMDKLMGNIARLNPQARNEVLKMLNRAMNRGEIKGML